MRDEIRRLVKLLCYVAFLASVAVGTLIVVGLIFGLARGETGAQLAEVAGPVLVLLAPFLVAGLACGVGAVVISLLHQIAQRLEQIEELLTPRPTEGTKVLTGGLQLKFPDKPTT